MKIHHISPPTQTGQANQNRNDGKVAENSTSKADAGPAAVTHLGRGESDTSQDIDRARVDQVRQAIADGKLDIRADKIADKLVNNAMDLVDGRNQS